MQNNLPERSRAKPSRPERIVSRQGRPITEGRLAPLHGDRRKPVLVTGATGYIGGRLVPRLLEAGHRIRCLVRDPAKLAARGWTAHPHVEIVRTDLADTDRLTRDMAGCGPAYYLVHSMQAAGAAYAEEDRRLASSFAAAAGRAGLSRIIYLGGLGETGERLSRHLSSRREVERLLASGKVPVTVLRAAMIIGSGSASFEILRYLVERLPVMITPRWVHTECQPIAIRDVLHYLTASLETPSTVGRTLDIGGPQVLSYREMMNVMAEARGLPRRLILPVPVLTPRLSSLWIHLVTPVGHRVARPLAEGLRNRVVCRNDEAFRLMPGPRPLTVSEAVEAALGEVMRDEVETSWSDAGVVPGDPDWAGGTVFVDRRTLRIDAPPAAVYRAVCRAGGGRGYYAADWLWRLRGALDRLVGGPGLRRGRRHRDRVAYGDALDFWRVTRVQENRRLELRAEMKLPGEATLTFRIRPAPGLVEASTCTQTARFKPRGLLGLAYWFALLPLHGLVFRGMLDGLRRDAERTASSRPKGTEAKPSRRRHLPTVMKDRLISSSERKRPCAAPTLRPLEELKQ